MIKKYLIIIILIVILSGGIIVYASFLNREESVKPIENNSSNDILEPDDNNEGDQSKEENQINDVDDNLPDVDTSDWKVYRNEEYGFEFKYHKEWKVTNDSFMAVTFLLKRKDCAYMIEVKVNPEYPTINNLDIDKEIEYYENKGTFVSEIKVENGVGIEFREQTKGGEIPAALIARKNCTIYINYEAFGVFSNDEYYQYKEVFDKILSSFKFVNI